MKKFSFPVSLISSLFWVIILLTSFRCPVAAEDITLKLWMMGGEGKLIGPLIKLFEDRNPGIKVTSQSISWDSAHEKLVTAIIGGITPDVCQLGTTWMSKFQIMDAFRPIDDFISESNFPINDFFEGSRQTNLFNGKTYGIPWYVDTRLLFYRDDILAEVGCTKFPDTWEEFDQLGEKLIAYKRSHGKKGYFFSFPLTDITFLMLYWGKGGNFCPIRGAKEYFSRELFLETAKMLKSFFKRDFNSLTEGGGMDYTDAFASGFYPIMLSGPWMASDLEIRNPGLEGHWKTAVLPKNKTRTSFIGGSNLVIFKRTKHPAEAWKFIQFMSEPSSQALWYKLAKNLPANRLAWDIQPLASNTNLLPFKQQFEDTCFPPAIPEWEHVAANFCGFLEEYINDRLDEAGLADKLSLKIHSMLEEKRTGQSIYFKICLATFIMFVPILGIFLYLRKESPGLFVSAHPPSPWIFLGPGILMIAIFRLLPIIASFVTSLTDWDMYGLTDYNKVSFIGLENYFKLFSDPIFIQSLKNTVVYVSLGVPLNLFFSLLVALAVNQPTGRLKILFRLGFFIPAVTTTVATAIVWKWLYNNEYGLLNDLLQMVGLARIHWLENPAISLISLVMMSVWKGFGYNMIIFLAALQNIPQELNEAVEIDGGDWRHKLIHVTFPYLKKTIFFVFVTTFVGYVHFFAEPYMVTGGGPLNSTMSVMLYTYQQGFKFYNLGYACSVVYFLFFFFCLFNFLQRKIRESLN
ncbi:MAG: extracellular solute-binding protein [Candidatus Riflebacteria bacterium]|nr:extracellular solute-binding protein [Candidatus Riflebacteria bacterium]